MKKKTIILVLVVLVLTLALVACKEESFSYTLTFDTNGGNDIAQITYDGSADIVLPTPEKLGYDFANWCSDENLQNSFNQKSISQDTTIYAKWTAKNYIISYITNGGDAIANTQHAFGSAINPPAAEKEGFAFGGWYIDEELSQPFESANMPAENITLYSGWNLLYNISYVLDGGENNAQNPAQYTQVTENITLAAPTKQHYDFKGWFAEATYNTQVTSIQTGSTGNRTLYAKWDLQTVVSDGFTLRNDGEGKFEVISTTLTSGEVVIPAQYGGMPVVKIGPQVFENSNITGVTVPASVVLIGYRAFAGCEELASVNFDEEGELYQIDQQAFMGCTAITEIKLPSSLVLMGTDIFKQCDELVTVYVERKIDWQLDYMGTHGAPGMFDGCDKLANIYVYRSNGTVPVWAENWEEVYVPQGAKDGVMEYKERNEWSNYAAIIKANPNEQPPQ